MKSRLLDQFRVSTNLKALLDVINERFDDSDALLEYLQYYRFLDTSSGVWLDTIGDIVGIPRPYDQIDDGIFTYKSAGGPDDADLAYSSVAGSTGGKYQSISGLETGDLIGDTEYRTLIKAKIFSTFAKPTIPNIFKFVVLTFSVGCTVTVPTPGQIEVELTDALTYFQRRMLVKYAPVASGYTINITNWP